MQELNQVIIIMEENIIVIRDPQTFYSNFYWHKDNDENLKHKIEFIITKRIDLKSSKKHVSLQNLSIYYTWKNIKQYKNKKL